jgi:bifunctional non-homologous end joining protein LigD
MKGRAQRTSKGNEWLLIKKRDEFASPGWDVEAHAYSVLSGRTQQEIAQNLPARETKRQAAGAADRVWDSSPPAKRGRRSGTDPQTGSPAARAASQPAPRKKKVRTSTSRP